MESVAAERLTKIGKNPSIVSSRADLEDDQKLFNEIVMESTPIPTSASEDDERDSDDSTDAKPKKRFKFDFRIPLQRISEEKKIKSRENIAKSPSVNKDLIDLSKPSTGSGQLPKVQSGTNVFGLKVPELSVRKRSGSVGDNLSIIPESKQGNIVKDQAPSLDNEDRTDSPDKNGGKASNKCDATDGQDNVRKRGLLMERKVMKLPEKDTRIRQYRKSKTGSVEDHNFLTLPIEPIHMLPTSVSMEYLKLPTELPKDPKETKPRPRDEIRRRRVERHSSTKRAEPRDITLLSRDSDENDPKLALLDNRESSNGAHSSLSEAAAERRDSSEKSSSSNEDRAHTDKTATIESSV